jgi:tetratricopeptide (TPR) repeat protein
VAGSLGHLASHYGRRGEAILALQTFHQAIETLPEEDDTASERAALLVEAGELLSTVGEHQEAADALHEAVRLLASIDDRELETALTFYAYARVLRDGGRLEEARDAARRALGLAESRLGEESTETVPYLRLYATLAAQTAEDEEAKRTWQRITTTLDPNRQGPGDARTLRCRSSTGAHCQVQFVDP